MYLGAFRPEAFPRTKPLILKEDELQEPNKVL
jgi:hypothetical protein